MLCHKELPAGRFVAWVPKIATRLEHAMSSWHEKKMYCEEMVARCKLICVPVCMLIYCFPYFHVFFDSAQLAGGSEAGAQPTCECEGLKDARNICSQTKSMHSVKCSQFSTVRHSSSQFGCGLRFPQHFEAQDLNAFERHKDSLHRDSLTWRPSGSTTLEMARSGVKTTELQWRKVCYKYTI